MTETRFYEPARLSTPSKPLFSLVKPLDATTWLKSLLSKVFQYKVPVLKFSPQLLALGEAEEECERAIEAAAANLSCGTRLVNFLIK